MQIDAIVLAGAKNKGKLQQSSDAQHEAAIPIHGKAMVDYVLDALRTCEWIRRVVVVGPQSLAQVITAPDISVVPSGESMIDNIRIGIEALKPKGKVLLCTSDIPLIGKAALEDFLQRCEGESADIYYPIVAKEVNEQMYPGVHRTYVHVTEGVFTGGNIVLLEPDVVYRGHELIEKAISMRKKPWQLARLMGGSFLFKLLFRKLSIKEIERRVHTVLGFRGVGVISPYPEVGIDVDKPSDLELVQRVLEKK